MIRFVLGRLFYHPHSHTYEFVTFGGWFMARLGHVYVPINFVWYGNHFLNLLWSKEIKNHMPQDQDCRECVE